MKKKILFLSMLFFANTQKITCSKNVDLIKEVTTKVMDRSTGNLYIGLDASSGSSSDAAIVALSRYNGYGNPTGPTIVKETDVSSSYNGIEFLTLSTKSCSNNPLLITVEKNSSGLKQQTTLKAFSINFPKNNKSYSLENIKDATANTTNGIVAIAASDNYAYAAVKPNSSGSLFGQAGSGLAAIEITNNTNINGDIILTQTNAQTGSSTTKIAKPINNTTSELIIESNSTISDPDPYAILHWDEQLQRLYIGVSQITNDTIGTAPGARSVIVAQSQTNGVVNFAKIAPDNAFNPGDTNQIVGVRTNSANYLTIGIKNLKTMHTSTGKSYLIINGDNAPGTTLPTTNVTPGNTIYALPLVDNPNSSTIHGTLANYTDPTFTTPATSPTDMLTNQDIPSQVGAGQLPLQQTQKISDIVVIGDTVYVSISETQAINSDPGIFYSQAMFDQYGRIYRWTLWTKRAFPASSPTGSQIAFLDVDAANGKIWAVGASGGAPTSTVFTTNWDSNSSSKSPTDMLGVLNKDFKCGCFCHLDLDQSTMGLAEQSPARYALFGGLEQVAFIRTSTSFAPSAPYDKTIPDLIPYAQCVTQDFSLPENYLLTYLPAGAGCVKKLEYSRSFNDPAQTRGYFFAGTQSGLYVFANENTGQGFAVGPTTNTLNSSPFSENSWKKINAIPGTIIDMVSSGNALYILTFQTSAQKPIINTLYKINFANTIDLMFNSSNLKIIAQNSTNATNSNLISAKMFYAISVTTTKHDANFYEQLLLATNNGIYRSNTFLGSGINNANNQEDAKWETINSEDTNTYTNIFTIDNTNILYPPNIDQITAFETVWPIQLSNKCNCKTFAKNNIDQLSGAISEENPTFYPDNFNSDIFACTGSCQQGSCQQVCCQQICCQNSSNNCSVNYINSVNAKFETLDPINYFWSDGARRFFVIKRSSDPSNINKLFVIPYNIQEWMITDPKTQVITDRTIQNIKNFYWLGPIGVSGIILAGTNNGFVALE